MAEQTPVGMVDTRGKTCPEPMFMMKTQLDTMKPGDIMEVIGDLINKRSMQRFVKMRRHDLLESTDEEAIFKMYIRKSENERTDIPISQCTLLQQ
jgi:TusA-related sulfurtransferase